MAEAKTSSTNTFYHLLYYIRKYKSRIKNDIMYNASNTNIIYNT